MQGDAGRGPERGMEVLKNLLWLRKTYSEMRRCSKYGPLYPWYRYIAPAAIFRTRAIHTESVSEVTVCVLTSRGDWIPCMWSLVSFYQLTNLRPALLIYSDGTLRERHKQKILAVFPNAMIADPEMTNENVLAKLASFPNCLEFRVTQPCARRIIDFPVLCKTKYIVMLDSDIVFLDVPEELKVHLEHPKEGRFVFERDFQNAYFAPPEVIKDDFGVDVSAHINCGIMMADVSEFNYCNLEKWLERREIMKHPWAEQTLWAMYAGADRSELLGMEYDVTMSPKIDPGSIMKHYIKPIRDFMYTDGIPRLKSILTKRNVLKG